MREGVVANNVSRSGDRARNVRPLLHVASDQEKRGMHPVPRQQFQQAQRVRIVGAIVVSQRDLPRAARQSRERPAIPLTRRRHGLIARSRRCHGGSCPGDNQAQHGEIVNC